MLRGAVIGKTLRNVRVLHRAQRRSFRPRDVTRARGAEITSVERRGKHQLLHLSTGDTIVVHFRMTGDWLIDRVSKETPRFARVVFELGDDQRVSLIDPRALSTVTLHRQGTESLPVLGPDATDPTLTASAFGESLARRRVPIKLALLDQRVLAGVGNIYAAEALWAAKISPTVAASSLTRVRQRKLLEAVRSVLAKAQRLQGRYRDGADGRFEVYDRAGAPCSRCGTAIERITQGQRSTYYCPKCQGR
jgi:formamidopyrimidine-DNA glycosylase